MLIASKNTLDMPRVMFDQISGHPVAQLTRKINHHHGDVVKPTETIIKNKGR